MQPVRPFSCYFLHHDIYTCRYATARAEPPIDASQDISNISASIQDGVTTINFVRPLASTDSDDLSLDVCRFFLYAYSGSVIYGNPNVISYHGFTNRGATSEMICLPSPAECPIPGKLLHGGLDSSASCRYLKVPQPKMPSSKDTLQYRSKPTLIRCPIIRLFSILRKEDILLLPVWMYAWPTGCAAWYVQGAKWSKFFWPFQAICVNIYEGSLWKSKRH